MAKKKKKRRVLSYLFSYDMNLIVAVLFLIVFGLVMIYSASYYTASMSDAFNHDPTFLLMSQLKYSILGIVVMLFVANVDYHFWKHFAMLGFLASIVLILLLKVPGLGVTVKGATRWIRIPGLGQFQVAEPVKVAMILFSATLIGNYSGRLDNMKNFITVLIPTAVVSVMILKISNNMSTATIVLGISFLMAFMVYPKYWPFVLMGGAGATGVGALIFYLKQKLASGDVGSGNGGFRGARILAWLDPYSYESDKAYQSLQALYAIGSGGLFGKGLGNSIQKLGRIPEPYNDMIFSIICFWRGADYPDVYLPAISALQCGTGGGGYLRASAGHRGLFPCGPAGRVESDGSHQPVSDHGRYPALLQLRRNGVGIPAI